MQMNFVSSRGDILPLVGNPYFTITNSDGMTAYAGNISASVTGGIDGDTVTNIQAQPRTIIVDIRIRNNANVEEAKRAILRIVKPKQYGALMWEQDGRTVSITAVVESFVMSRWTNGVVGQITLHCEQPFWEDIDAVIQQISEAIDLHYFTDGAADMLYFPTGGIAFGEYDTIRTKHFYNSGDVSVGLEISIVAIDTVTNPIIYNSDGSYFGVGYTSRPLVMETGDNVIITTHKGNKAVTMNGVNIFDKIKPSSSWLQLETGDNSFTINSDDESTANMSFALIYKQKYV